jgi:hypothetical protein
VLGPALPDGLQLELQFSFKSPQTRGVCAQLDLLLLVLCRPAPFFAERTEQFVVTQILA